MDTARETSTQPGDPFRADAAWIVFRRSQLLLTADGTLQTDCGRFLAAAPPLRVLRLGRQGSRDCFVAEVAEDREPPQGQQFRHLRGLLDSLPAEQLELAGRGLQLLEFDRTHAFCGACGAPTALQESAVMRRCTRAECAREHYPRVSPVVIVAVERGPEILLGRSPHFPPGLYSALAGFVDAGESAEQAVHREIFEETALRVRNLRYFASQPWPFPHSLMLGYHADYAGGEIVCAVGEIEDARFFHIDRLPALFPVRYTMANMLLADFCRRHGRKLPQA